LNTYLVLTSSWNNPATLPVRRLGHVNPDDVAEEEPFRHTVAIRAPQYHVADTAWGTQYAGYRAAGAVLLTVALPTSCFRAEALGQAAAHWRRIAAPLAVRDILRDINNGTASAAPSTDRIGAMPDFQKIIASQGL
jgi:hypothetical protein